MEDVGAGTVVLRVKPQIDTAVTKLGDEIIRLAMYAQSLVITGNEDLARATNDLTLMLGLKKSLEESRREYVAPLQAHESEVNDVFRKLREPLMAAVDTIKAKMVAYQEEEKRKQEKEEEINVMRRAAAEKQMELKGELSEPVDEVEVRTVATVVRTDVGTATMVMIKKFEVVDFAALPDEFKLPDAVKIGKVVRAGIGHIPGVRIYEEANVRGTAKR